MTSGRLLVGTSGFAYPEWIGTFYPEGTRAKGMLSYYASRFGTVEVNYTFRQHPKPAMLATWVAQTPETFVFAAKANQGITHGARLRGAAERLDRFFTAVAPLGERLGPVLFQCPPNMQYDPDKLAGFLADLAAEPQAKGRRFAMEFRHESFSVPDVRAQLAEAGVALCIADTDERPETVPDLDPAPGFVYLRLRRTRYKDVSLAAWGDALKATIDGGTDVYAFLKHEDSGRGPRYAARLLSRCGVKPKRPTSRPARPRRP